MDRTKAALQEQYHAALAMLALCVERCPAELWSRSLAGVPEPDRPFLRSYWRIAFHGAFFTHLYLGQSDDHFQPPPPDMAVAARPDCEPMWRAPWPLEPFELPEDAEPPTPDDLLAYIRYVDRLIDETVANLDLEAAETGIPWYKNMSKLSHQLLNLRHLQGHVGQLSELLMPYGIDVDWVSRSPGMTPCN